MGVRMGPSKLRAIGEALKAEEDRFIGYAEIERRSKELGFGMTVRTLRFYVDEGILPPPKKVGNRPICRLRAPTWMMSS